MKGQRPTEHEIVVFITAISILIVLVLSLPFVSSMLYSWLGIHIPSDLCLALLMILLTFLISELKVLDLKTGTFRVSPLHDFLQCVETGFFLLVDIASITIALLIPVGIVLLLPISTASSVYRIDVPAERLIMLDVLISSILATCIRLADHDAIKRKSIREGLFGQFINAVKKFGNGLYDQAPFKSYISPRIDPSITLLVPLLFTIIVLTPLLPRIVSKIIMAMQPILPYFISLQTLSVIISLILIALLIKLVIVDYARKRKLRIDSRVLIVFMLVVVVVAILLPIHAMINTCCVTNTNNTYKAVTEPPNPLTIVLHTDYYALVLLCYILIINEIRYEGYIIETPNNRNAWAW